MTTLRQRHGTLAENAALTYLGDLGWRVLARNVRLGRDEIDIVAIDPGTPLELVCVEVRSAVSAAFGAPEERVDRTKVGHLYRAASAFAGARGLSWRVDLIIVDRRSGESVVRHLRRLEPA
jgi:putative endonuclease